MATFNMPCCEQFWRALDASPEPPEDPMSNMNTSDEDEETDGTAGDLDVDDDKIIINVGGTRHETLASSLVRKTGTRLSYLGKKHRKGCKEYFYDRHPGVFGTVMDYYRSGELHVPLDVCGAVVKRELDYWKIDATMIEPCCWTSYSSYIDNQKTLSDFNQEQETEAAELDKIKKLTGVKRKQMIIWMILDHPRSSSLAMGYAVTSFAFVLASIAGFCIETLPALYTVENVTRECGPDRMNKTVIRVTSHPFLENLDYICTAFFTLELIVRVLFAPNKLAFFRSIMNIIDILALMPLYVQIILDLTESLECLRNDRAVLETIFVLRIIRIFRVFHLVKHYKALKILVHAIKASIHELLMLSIFLFIATLVFSTLIFYAERPLDSAPMQGATYTEPGFGTIPIGFWWSIITMTTVGYGDVHPTSAMGYAIGAMCAVCGVLLLALTIPVISNHFALFYLHARTREEISKRKSSCDGTNNSDAAKIKDKLSSESLRRRRGQDSRALLSQDSISTTDEGGPVGNTSRTTSADDRPTDTHHAVRVPIADIDETIM